MSIKFRNIIPTDILNCQLWLDAMDINTLTLDDINVSQWNDKSGNGYNCLNTGINRPTYSSTNTINNINTPTFNGKNKWLYNIGNSISIANSNVLTAFIVAEKIDNVDNPNPRMASFYKNGEDNDFDNISSFFMGNNSDETNLICIRNNITYSNFSKPTNGIPFIYTTKFDGTNNIGYLNGAASSSIASSGNFNIQNYKLGGGQWLGIDIYFWDGKIGEVIVYDRALNDIERVAIQNYLSNKWGISI